MPTNETKQKIHQQILDAIDDTQYAYWVYPHHGLLPDYFQRYWDLAELVHKYFDEPFYKPQKSTVDQVK